MIKVNQFLLQVDNAGDTFLTCGTLTPPVLLGTDREVLLEQARALEFVPVRGVARYALSVKHVHELIKVLQDGLTMLESQRGSEGRE